MNDPVGIALMIGMIELAGRKPRQLLDRRQRSSRRRWESGSRSASPGHSCCYPSCGACGSRRPLSSRSACSQARESSTAPPRFSADPASWRCSSRDSSWATRPRHGRTRSRTSLVAHGPRGDRRVRCPRALGRRRRPRRSRCLGRWARARARARARRAPARRLPAPRSSGSAPPRARLHRLGRAEGRGPILLGTLAILAAVDGAERLYGIVVVVVLFSVLVQGTSVPFAARTLRIPFRRVADPDTTASP